MIFKNKISLRFFCCGLLLLILCTGLRAQYFNFSQFEITPLRVNPAAVAASDYQEINLIYRNQNTAVDFNINSSGFSYHRPFMLKKSGKRWAGIGITALDDRAGRTSLLNNQHLGLTAGFNLDIGEQQFINIGFSSLIKRLHFSLDGLTTGFQYLPTTGFNANVTIGENLGNESITTIGHNMGVIWQKVDEEGEREVHFGWALYDLNQPAEYERGSDDLRLPHTNIFQLGARAFKGTHLQVYPQVLFTVSGNITNVNTGIAWDFMIPEKNRFKSFSKLTVKTQYVVGSYATVGLRLHAKQYSLGLSYDLGIASTQVANAGAVEVSFAYRSLVRREASEEEIVEKEEATKELENIAKVQDEIVSPPETIEPPSKLDTISITQEEIRTLKEEPNIEAPIEKKSIPEKTVERSAETRILPEFTPKTSIGELIYTNVKMEKVNITCEFDFNQAILKSEVSDYLSDLTQSLEGKNVIAIEIIGHTDQVGPDAYNMKLSTRRAQAIADFLAARGVEWTKMSVTGKGESQPISATSTDEENRRVEILIFSQQ